MPEAVDSFDLEMPGNAEMNCNSDDDIVSLPSDVDLDDPADGLHCQCNRKCHTKFSNAIIEQHRHWRLGLLAGADASSHGLMQRAWGQVKECFNVIGRTKWIFQGEEVCLKFWQNANAISPHTMDHIRKCFLLTFKSVASKLATS